MTRDPYSIPDPDDDGDNGHGQCQRRQEILRQQVRRLTKRIASLEQGERSRAIRAPFSQQTRTVRLRVRTPRES
jgi:hypothetical protein